MHKKFLKFPDNFLWGAATASHQVEGDCQLNDWSHTIFQKHQADLSWAAKALQKIPDVGTACDHWHKYAQDFEILQKLNNRTYRLSIEWARIEPQKGHFDRQALDHYRGMLEDLKHKNIKVMLTLHHFTNPAWLMLEKGWQSKKSIKYFLRYTKFIVEELGDLVDFWITINEPDAYVFCSYFKGWWPPLETSFFKGLKVFWHMARAHTRAYHLIHQTLKNKFNLQAQVGFANALQAYTNYIRHKFIDQLQIYLVYKISNHGFYILSGKKNHDFLGVNYYFQVRLKRKSRSLLPLQSQAEEEDRFRTDTNWLVHPHGIYEVLLDLSSYHKPIYITENGIATQDDEKRKQFIHEHLEEVYYAIRAGVDIRGYYYWSLLDNYEWAEGYRPKFGLVEVDPSTLERRLKSSAHYYAQIAQQNGVWMDY